MLVPFILREVLCFEILGAKSQVWSLKIWQFRTVDIWPSRFWSLVMPIWYYKTQKYRFSNSWSPQRLRLHLTGTQFAALSFCRNLFLKILGTWAAKKNKCSRNMFFWGLKVGLQLRLYDTVKLKSARSRVFDVLRGGDFIWPTQNLPLFHFAKKHFF